ncbi:MAG: low molecular weight phosphotyrosine protein phosphatase [Armatimonadetes bacterium]|nr:low molecular weight phosphotyrosine protein phosphatase [Armatimonadota bacterium]
MIRVLFVCLGNICRSTMAEAVFQQLVQEAGLTHSIKTDSAGTGAWHIGKPPHERTARLLLSKGITGYMHHARQVQRDDFQIFDYILTMDDENLADVNSLGVIGKAVVAPLLEFAPQLEAYEVPDPYYNDRYEEVYDLVSVACAGLLTAICEEHALLLR